MAVLVVVLLPLLAAATAWGVASPYRVLCLYAATVPFGSGVVVPGPLPSPFNTLSTVLGAAATVAVLLHLGQVPGRRRDVPLAVPVLILFLAWTVQSVAWSVAPATSLRSIAVLVSLVALFLLCQALNPTRRLLRQLEVAIVLGGAGTGAYGIVLSLTNQLGVPGESVARFATAGGGGEGGDPNITAASLLLPLILAVAGTQRRAPRRTRVAYLLATVSIAGGILLTGSRGGLLAALGGCLLLLMQLRRPGVVLLQALAAVLVVLVGLALVPSGLDDRFRSADSTGRSDIWRVGLSTCEQYCLQGSGANTFPLTYRRALLADPNLAGHGGVRDFKAHNMWLALSTESGVVGVVLMGVFLTCVVRRVRRLPPDLRSAPQAAVGALLISNLLLNNVNFKYFWLVLIYAWLATNVVDDPTRPPDDGLPGRASPDVGGVHRPEAVESHGGRRDRSAGALEPV